MKLSFVLLCIRDKLYFSTIAKKKYTSENIYFVSLNTSMSKVVYDMHMLLFSLSEMTPDDI